MRFSSCLIAFFVCGVAAAQTPLIYEDFTLLASDAALGDLCGTSVAVSGQVAIVGAPKNDDNGAESGSAYIYRYDGATWVEEQILTASDGSIFDWFGDSVSISGDVAVVGARQDDNVFPDTGSAYIFRFNGATWVEEAKLIASDAAGGDFFGVSVSISGDVIVVGAYGDNTSTGSAYIYRFDGTSWNEEVKLLASDASTTDSFGSSVSISGSRVMVGSRQDDDNGSNSGSVYMYKYNGVKWFEEAKLIASDGAGGDLFGASVAITGNFAIVGAVYDTDNGAFAGSAYIFRFQNNTWNESAKLLASIGGSSDYFGGSVSIFNNKAIVGASGADVGGASSGAAFIYHLRNNFWVEEAVFTSSTAASNDRAGSCVFITADNAFVGAPYDDSHGFDAGSMYVIQVDDIDGDGVYGTNDNCDLYNPDQLDCNENSIGDVCDIAYGTSVDCDENSVPDDCQPDCNDNGIADVCDITNGTEYDCNGNGIPDSCDLAPVFQQENKFLASDGAIGDNFGTSVSISGDVAIIGAKLDDDNGSNAGSAYIYRFDGFSWNEEAKLLASDGAVDDWFGGSVSISGDVAVVGATQNDDFGTDSGSAYVFRFDGISWTEESKLLASNGTSYDSFGFDVSIESTTLIVGANRGNGLSASTGVAYIFTYDGSAWTEEAVLVASDGLIHDSFGSSVSISGNVAAVGAYYDDDFGSSSGSVYIYRRVGNVWTEETKLVASDSAASDFFGASVIVSGGTVIVGSGGSDGNVTDSGAAYIYRYDGSVWIQEAKLFANNGSDTEYFGSSVSIFGNTAVVGASSNDVNGMSNGAAYTFRFDGSTWIQNPTHFPTNWVGIYNQFGNSVSISGNTVFMGAMGDDETANSAGAVYTFTSSFLVEDCNSNGVPDVCDVMDMTNDLNSNGIPDDCECLADITQDGVVDISDLLNLIASWNNNFSPADLNYDGIVDVSDLLILVAQWGSCI